MPSSYAFNSVVTPCFSFFGVKLVGVDGGQPAEVLPDPLEVLQALVLPPHDGRHPPQRRPLQLLAAVQRVPELEQPDVVLGHVVDEVAGGVDLS